MLKLLCITAHPDDEAGAFGGTLRLCHDRGIETSVICLTAGTAARNRGSARTSEELAELRRAEFAASCKVLGIAEGEVLDYPDGTLDRADLYGVCEVLVHRIRQCRPHVVLTFGADGGLTSHPDHAMAGVFGTLAFQWAGRAERYPEQLGPDLQPHRAQKLYYAAADYRIPNAPPTAPPTVTARIDIGAERLQMKVEAFWQHTTQSPLFGRLEQNVSRRGAVEMFHLAATHEPCDAKFETDLFDGVVED